MKFCKKKWNGCRDHWVSIDSFFWGLALTHKENFEVKYPGADIIIHDSLDGLLLYKISLSFNDEAEEAEFILGEVYE